MQNRADSSDRAGTADQTGEYQLSLSDLEPPCGITDCLDDVIFSLCDTSHSVAVCKPAPASSDQLNLQKKQLDYCQQLRHRTNADTVYLCERDSLHITTTSSQENTEDTKEMHQALTSVLGNLNNCEEAFHLPNVHVFPNHPKLSFTVIPLQCGSASTLRVYDSPIEYLAIIVEADEDYRQINPYISDAIQSIYTCFMQAPWPPANKQIERAVFDLSLIHI